MCSANLPQSVLAIDVWSIPLVVPQSLEHLYRETLTEDELRRADRYLLDRHRLRFIAGRCRMRSILAKYLNCRPGEISFQYETLGKPSIQDPQSDMIRSFNFSNSAELGLLAISQIQLELGIDVERPRQLSDLLGLAKRYFHPEEIKKLERASDAEREQTFFRCWTRKEAYLKAVGSGLTFPLHKVLVTVASDEEPEICSIEDSRQRGKEWQLHHWDANAPYLGAIAYRSKDRAILRPCAWTAEDEELLSERSS